MGYQLAELVFFGILAFMMLTLSALTVRDDFLNRKGR